MRKKEAEREKEEEQPKHNPFIYSKFCPVFCVSYVFRCVSRLRHIDISNIRKKRGKTKDEDEKKENGKRKRSI